jgi:hypothetical protein
MVYCNHTTNICCIILTKTHIHSITLNTYLLLGCTCATYTDLRPSFLPLEFSVKIPAAPKISLSDLRSLTLFVFLPVKKIVKVIKISKQNIPSLCNKMHKKLNKGIKKQELFKKYKI